MNSVLAVPVIYDQLLYEGKPDLPGLSPIVFDYTGSIPWDADVLETLAARADDLNCPVVLDREFFRLQPEYESWDQIEKECDYLRQRMAIIQAHGVKVGIWDRPSTQACQFAWRDGEVGASHRKRWSDTVARMRQQTNQDGSRGSRGLIHDQDFLTPCLYVPDGQDDGDTKWHDYWKRRLDFFRSELEHLEQKVIPTLSDRSTSGAALPAERIRDMILYCRELGLDCILWGGHGHEWSETLPVARALREVAA